MYINFHSQYSFRYGTLSPTAIIEKAVEHQINQLALTDINSTAGCLEFLRLCEENNIKGICGVEFRNGMDKCFIALARNEEGFREINSFLSEHQMQKHKIPRRAPLGWKNVWVIYPFEIYSGFSLEAHEFIGLRASQLLKLKFSALLKQQQKLVILQPVTLFKKQDYNAHRLLRAIDNNILLSRLQPGDHTSIHDQFYSPAALSKAFAEFPTLLRNTEDLLQSCERVFSFADKAPSLNRRFYMDRGELSADRAKIRQLCASGLRYRYGENPAPRVIERMESELRVIEQSNFYSYFLINWDIVNYARSRGFFYVGRGSGANSMVAYLLRITDVDPLDLDLYFERFMNPYRRQPPDFDVDFSWRDREEITAYIFKRFPAACLLGSHTTFQYKGVVREIGKVLGLPAREIDQLSNPRLNPRGLDNISRLVIQYSRFIHEFPNHMTVHSSGIVIPDRSIYYYGATFMPPKGFATTHFDMYSAEDIGLHKFDILGQRGLGKIKDAVEIIRQNHPTVRLPDIHNIEPFVADEKVKNLLREGKTMACFYVESPAMRALLTKLRGDTYRSLVAASSIIRPGVAQSGMMQEYIKRFRNPESRQYIHPRLGEILAETYGVMVYQEDVLKVAHQFAGLTLGEADILRRGMSWKFRERNQFATIRDKFFENCREKGYSESISQEVWRQIESFGNFAFAKGHSASYAVESYQSLFLKAYYPLEYMVATLNNGGGFYNAEVYINEARLHGGDIQAPCINHSQWECCIRQKKIYLGFNLIRELEEIGVQHILNERNVRGAFLGLQDFTDRVAISLEQLIILIRIGAFRFSKKSKKELLWEAHFLLGGSNKSVPVPDLFRVKNPELKLPPLESEDNEDAFDEMEILGFPLSSPFELIPAVEENISLARELPHLIGKEVCMLGYLIHVKNLHTRQKVSRHMQFGTFLDIRGDFIDTVHFPEVAEKYHFSGRGIYLLKGRVLEEYDFINLQVTALEKIHFVKGEILNRAS